MGRMLLYLVGIAAGLATLGCEAGANRSEVIYHEKSAYNDIYVCREGSVVSLRFGGPDARLTQSQVDRENERRLLLEYSRLCFAAFLYNPKPKRILVVGMGGGVLPREFHHYYPKATIDVVEIDPAIPPVAKKFFGFPSDPHLNVHVADGRKFVEGVREEEGPRYDLILLDAYGSEEPPFHLLTKEFLGEVRAILSDDGVVLGNILRTYRHFDSVMKTYLDVFGRCQAYEGVASTNTVLVALGEQAPALSREEAKKKARRLNERFSVNLLNVTRRLKTELRPADDATVLTDAMRDEER